MKHTEHEFTNLVNEHRGTIYTVCYMFSKDADEVADLFQEILVNLWRGFEQFRGESKPATWIYKVALNTCISVERNKKKHAQSIPLSMDINLFEDTDADSCQVQMLRQRIGQLGAFDRAIILLPTEEKWKCKILRFFVLLRFFFKLGFVELSKP